MSCGCEERAVFVSLTDVLLSPRPPASASAAINTGAAERLGGDSSSHCVSLGGVGFCGEEGGGVCFCLLVVVLLDWWV
jgi:hypothetical protein